MVAGVQLAHKEQAVAEILQGVIADCTEAGQVVVDAVGMVVALRVECSGHDLEGVLDGILGVEAGHILGAEAENNPGVVLVIPVVLGGNSALDPGNILGKDLEHILGVERGCNLVEGRKSTTAVVFEDSLVVLENNFGDVHAVVHADVVLAGVLVEVFAEVLAGVHVVVYVVVIVGVLVVVIVVAIAAVENAEVVLVVGDFYVDGDGGPS